MREWVLRRVAWQLVMPQKEFLEEGLTIKNKVSGVYDLKLIAGEESFVLQMVNDILADIPVQYSLGQNYPNPFNPITKLKYFLPEDGNVEVYIYDLNGKIVKSIMSQYKTAGFHSIIWNSLNNDGNSMPSGIYFCSVTFNNISKSIKMAFLK